MPSRPRPKSIMKPSPSRTRDSPRGAVAGRAEALKIGRGAGGSIVGGLPQRLLPNGHDIYLPTDGCGGLSVRHNVLQVASTIGGW